MVFDFLLTTTTTTTSPPSFTPPPPSLVTARPSATPVGVVCFESVLDMTDCVRVFCVFFMRFDVRSGWLIVAFGGSIGCSGRRSKGLGGVAAGGFVGDIWNWRLSFTPTAVTVGSGSCFGDTCHIKQLFIPFTASINCSIFPFISLPFRKYVRITRLIFPNILHVSDSTRWWLGLGNAFMLVRARSYALVRRFMLTCRYRFCLLQAQRNSFHPRYCVALLFVIYT